VAHSTTLEEVFLDRVSRGGSDIFFEVYCAAYASGAGLPDPTPHSESMRQLLWLLADRHRTEVLLPRGYDPTPIEGRNPPGWLLGLMRQRDTTPPPCCPDSVEGPVEGWPV